MFLNKRNRTKKEEEPTFTYETQGNGKEVVEEIGEELKYDSPLYKLEHYSEKEIYLLIRGLYIKIEVNKINYGDNLVELNLEGCRTLQNIKKPVGDVKIEIEEGVFKGELINKGEKCCFRFNNFISFSNEERRNQKRECSRLELIPGEEIEKFKKIIFDEKGNNKDINTELKLENRKKGEIYDLSTKGIGFIVPENTIEENQWFLEKEIKISMAILGEEINLPVIIKSTEPNYEKGIVKIGGMFNYKEEHTPEKDHLHKLLRKMERKIIQELQEKDISCIR